MTGATPTIGVLSLQGDVREHLRALVDAGADAVPVDTADQLGTIDALVTSLGRASLAEKAAAAADAGEAAEAGGAQQGPDPDYDAGIVNVRTCVRAPFLVVICIIVSASPVLSPQL